MQDRHQTIDKTITLAYVWKRIQKERVSATIKSYAKRTNLAQSSFSVYD